MPEEAADSREEAAQLLGKYLADVTWPGRDADRYEEWVDKETTNARRIIDLIVQAAAKEMREAPE